MAAVMPKHLATRPVLAGEEVTVADYVAEYEHDRPVCDGATTARKAELFPETSYPQALY